jgi:simple sugar transport system permease protein
MKRWDPRRVLPIILAPIGALLLAAAISSVALLISGKDPFDAFSAMFEYAFGPSSGPDVTTEILNKATSYYIAALAVAIGFRMGLFNIGVDGQSRLATLAAGALGAASFLAFVPGPVRIVVMVVVAMAVGAAWAGVAALLKVYRGVSEVISTIMLNFIGGAIFAYLLTTERLGVKAPGGEIVSTPILPEDSWLNGFQLFPNTANRVFDFIFVAIALGVAYWFLLGRTRFGFDLRATGMNPSAAVASGVNAKRMVIATMLLSGGVAGLVALPEVIGRDHAVTTSVPALGFTGIAIALLGRNNPIGIALASLLWAFLDVSNLPLDLLDIPKEIVAIMQGVTLLAVVVAYELAARISRRQQQRRVGMATGEAAIVTLEIPASIAAKPGVQTVSATIETAEPPRRPDETDRPEERA